MGRNFFSRVEACFLIDDKRLRERIIKDGLNVYLSDNSRAWTLRPDGTYIRSKPGSARTRDAQLTLMDKLAEDR